MLLGDEAVACFAIAVERALDDIGGQFGSGGRFVPSALVDEGFEVFAQELFVETGLCAAGLVGAGGPEAGTVGGEGFVDEDWLVVDVASVFVDFYAELELGVCDDDASCLGVCGGEGIHGEGEIAESVHERRADGVAGLVEGDVFVVCAAFGFGGGGEDGVRESLALGEPGRERHATDRTRVAVVAPARAFEIASDDALDGDDAAAETDHASAVEVGARGGVGKGGCGDEVGIGREQVCAADAGVVDFSEPECGDFGQQDALARDGCGHDDIECGDAVGGDEQQGCVVFDGAWWEVIDIADLTLAAM